METLQNNKIKRNTIAIHGISTIDTNATKKGDEIKAYKNSWDGANGWTLLNTRIGEYFYCTSDLLRKYIIITEQITE